MFLVCLRLRVIDRHAPPPPPPHGNSVDLLHFIVRQTCWPMDNETTRSDRRGVATGLAIAAGD